jgi:GYF domain 2
MADRSWFFALDGKQHGPYPAPEFRSYVANGTIRADTLVWTEGMANWQRASEIPGLMSGGSSAPTVQRAEGAPASRGGYGSGPISFEFEIWDFTWRSLVLVISVVFIIPLPWALLMYCRWIVSCAHIPQRPNLGFTGRAVDLMWFYAAALLFIAAAWTQSQALNLAVDVVQLVLYWLLIKWFMANLTSNGRPLELTFSGSFWGFLGWSLLSVVSIITIVGWAWVYVAQLRWMCRHIEGTRREVEFNATGLEFLWRSLVTALGSLFIIPIPWMYRWFTRWLASQIALVDRGTLANA